MKDFIPHEPAFALKELGFDEPCLGYYLCRNSAFGIDDLLITTESIDLLPYDSSSCKAPTYSQAFAWFREKHTLGAIVSQFGWSIENEFGQIIHNISDDENLLCYPESELACLIRLIEITRTK
jgi:hypothetical protein